MRDDNASDLLVAATVVLLRDGADGLEVLLLERPHDRGSFTGAWVFPGGGLDPADSAESEEAGARNAAAREAWEETGLLVDADSLVTVSCWIPPLGIPKRRKTWFFFGPAASGDIVLPPEEAVDFAWLRPAEALERHAEGRLLLVPPTWVTLHDLAQDASVDAALVRARASQPRQFETRFAEDRKAMLWAPDVAWEDESRFEHDGARHRLEIGRLPWVYSRREA